MLILNQIEGETRSDRKNFQGGGGGGAEECIAPIASKAMPSRKDLLEIYTYVVVLPPGQFDRITLEMSHFPLRFSILSHWKAYLKGRTQPN